MIGARVTSYSVCVALLALSVHGASANCTMYERDQMVCHWVGYLEYLDAVNRLTAPLASLTMSHCRIPQINYEMFSSPFVASAALLFLQNNNMNLIDDGAFRDMKRVAALYIDDNYLADVTPYTFHGMYALESLWATGAGIERIASGAFETNTKLAYLGLADNFLRRVENGSFAGLRSLRHLNLGASRIVAIVPNSFEDLVNVDTLVLAKNGIERLENGTFAGLSNLLELDLNANNITELNYDAFVGLDKLRALDIRGNDIRNLDVDKLHSILPSLTTLLHD